MAIRKVKPFRFIGGERFTFGKVFSRIPDAQDYADRIRARGRKARIITESTQQGKRHFVWVR